MNREQFEKRFLDYSAENNFFTKGEKVVVAVSGGADSICLLLALVNLRGNLDVTPVVCHINHGIRGAEADRDEAYVKSMAERFGVEVVTYRENVPEYAREHKIGEEEAGRLIRYKRMGELCEKCGAAKIVVAHNSDDKAETVIFNLVRGASLTGLAGIKPRSVRGQYEIIRPLLCFRRQEIEEYLNLNSIRDWCMDSTNDLDSYARNRIRHNIMPELVEVCSSAVEHIGTTAEDVKGAMEYVDSITASAYARRYSDHKLQLTCWDRVPNFIKMQLCYRFICEEAGRKKDISRDNVKDVVGLSENAAGKRIHLPYGLVIRKSYDCLIAEKARTSSAEKTDHSVKISMKAISNEGKKERQLLVFTSDMSGGEFVKKEAYGFKATVHRIEDYEKLNGEPFDFRSKPDTVYFDAAKVRALGDTVVVRTPQYGDFFCAFEDGRTKNLSRLFIDAKVPDNERALKKCVFMENHCLWVPGLRNDETLRIDKTTTKVLELVQVTED